VARSANPTTRIVADVDLIIESYLGLHIGDVSVFDLDKDCGFPEFDLRESTSSKSKNDGFSEMLIYLELGILR
jgi:hypothetical protein